MTRRALIVIVLLGVLTLAAGFSAAAVVYDRVSRVADCAERFGDNSPAAWSVRGIASAVPDFNGTHLFVADYREVLIPSRDPGIDLRAWWLQSRDGDDAPSIIVVHGILDGLIDVSHAQTIAEVASSAGVLVDRWIVADTGHVDAVLVHPEGYERRLSGFFATAFAS